MVRAVRFFQADAARRALCGAFGELSLQKRLPHLNAITLCERAIDRTSGDAEALRDRNVNEHSKFHPIFHGSVIETAGAAQAELPRR